MLAYVSSGHVGENLDRVDAWDSQNIFGKTQEDFIPEMWDVASRSNTKKPFYHLSINFDPNDEDQKNISDERAFETARRLLDKMGLEAHQAVFAIHRDTEHPHVHVFLNRVTDDGKLWDTKHDYVKSMSAMREVELEMGLNHPEKKHNIDFEREQILRVDEGKKDWKILISTRVDQAIADSNGTFEDFQTKLKNNYFVDVKINSNGTGMSYMLLDYKNDENLPIKMGARKIGKFYQKNAIDNRLEGQREILKKNIEEKPSITLPEISQIDYEHFKEIIHHLNAEIMIQIRDDERYVFQKLLYSNCDVSQIDQEKISKNYMNAFILAARQTPFRQEASYLNAIYQTYKNENKLSSIAKRGLSEIFKRTPLKIINGIQYAHDPKSLANFVRNRVQSEILNMIPGGYWAQLAMNIIQMLSRSSEIKSIRKNAFKFHHYQKMKEIGREVKTTSGKQLSPRVDRDVYFRLAKMHREDENSNFIKGISKEPPYKEDPLYLNIYNAYRNSEQQLVVKVNELKGVLSSSPHDSRSVNIIQKEIHDLQENIVSHVKKLEIAEQMIRFDYFRIEVLDGAYFHMLDTLHREISAGFIDVIRKNSQFATPDEKISIMKTYERTLLTCLEENVVDKDLVEKVGNALYKLINASLKVSAINHRIIASKQQENSHDRSR